MTFESYAQSSSIPYLSTEQGLDYAQQVQNQVVANPTDLTTLSLFNYVQLVLTQSLEAQLIADRLNSAQLSLDTAQFAFEFQWVPSVNLSATDDINTQGVGLSANKRNEFGTQFSVGTRYDRTSSDTGDTESPVVFARIEQGLFRNWGQEAGRYRLDKAELDRERNLWAAVGEKQSLIRRAVQQYFSVLLAQERLVISKNNLIRAEKNLEIAESRYELGLVPKTDIYRAQLQQLNIKDVLDGDENNLFIQRRQFIDLINGTLGQNFTLDDDLVSFRAPILPRRFEKAYSLRSDWQTFKIDLADLKLDVKNAERNLLPDVNLFVSGERYLDGYQIGNTDLSDSVDWRFGLTYSTPLNLIAERNSLAQIKIRYAALQRNQVAIERRIQQQIMDSFDTASSAQRRLDIAQERVKQAEQAAELAEIRFQRGLASNLDLIDAETELQNARNQVLQQQINVNLAIVTYALRSGSLDFKWLEQNVVSSKTAYEKR